MIFSIFAPNLVTSHVKMVIVFSFYRSCTTLWHRRLGACVLSAIQERPTWLRESHLECCQLERYRPEIWESEAIDVSQ